MSATALPDLIKRLEAAEGASRELDVLIGAAVDVDCGIRVSLAVYIENFGIDRATEAADAHNSILRTQLPRYTASVDSALTLVPEGWGWLRKSPGTMSVYDARIDYDGTKTWAVHIDGGHKLPAIALTIACLKARLP